MTQHTLRTALLDARVPRYTSYPPANRFSPAVGAETSAAWAADLPAGADLSLYVHVPFCRRLCWFCACRTQGTTSDAPLDSYLSHLEREVALVAPLLPAGHRTSALHLGGGTPTLLSADRLDRLGEILAPVIHRDAATEVAVEIDPCELDAPRLDALLRLGLTRASIGVQDFDPAVQAAIGREQSPQVTAHAVDGLRARGVAGVNFDLLYGLPHQTEARLVATLTEALRHRPDRVALFGYAHVPWMSRRQKLIAEEALPDAAARLHLNATARALLEAEGYVSIGIDHFALPHDSLVAASAAGRLHRNFQGYTTDDAAALIGLGPSSISRYPQGYAQNAPATGAWAERVMAGSLATVRGYALSPEDALTAEVIERLMCDAAADLPALAARHGAPAAPLLALAEAGMTRLPGAARLSDGVLSVADAALSRIVAAWFDEGLTGDTGRFSMAS
ncbi:oxygen-independent coproporphyrinogen III oxidase [Pseudoroseicyclus tamaricis]|uniref:Coproporphyrinogen-III oxidase n=1 Tax=Pseudoroseicyclus tamaricis TaxID=2705421 RepID=A0A6B2JIR0_9RHOB|nr:oxygen-independent coproporphyrinogen III oxidase [Pseudoroseicyclus tamaricis]NDV01283.1 oxygen-independent coproporphyrinogen III oxidase [Pseudoroseicyclus tamaricis]